MLGKVGDGFFILIYMLCLRDLRLSGNNKNLEDVLGIDVCL